MLQIGMTAGLSALAETTLLMGLGHLMGRMLGWTTVAVAAVRALIEGEGGALNEA